MRLSWRGGDVGRRSLWPTMMNRPDGESKNLPFLNWLQSVSPRRSLIKPNPSSPLTDPRPRSIKHWRSLESGCLVFRPRCGEAERRGRKEGLKARTRRWRAGPDLCGRRLEAKGVLQTIYRPRFKVTNNSQIENIRRIVEFMRKNASLTLEGQKQSKALLILKT